MKRIKWTFLSFETNHGTEENPKVEQFLIPKDFSYSDEALEAAKIEAYNGEYEIYEDGLPESIATPSQLDIIEAQVAYTAMMTDTLLEV